MKLAIVQCGGSKIWTKHSIPDKVMAKDAYISPYFKFNRLYAEKIGDAWLILSAKYGYLKPEDLIENYNVTFKKEKTNPISIEELKKQVISKGLEKYNEIIVLGGKEYLEAVELSFDGLKIRITAPFKGLPIGKRMALLKTLIGKE